MKLVIFPGGGSPYNSHYREEYGLFADKLQKIAARGPAGMGSGAVDDYCRAVLA